MGLLRTRKLSPAEEAERQSAILTEIERQREERQAKDRALTAEVAMKKRQMWAEQQASAEERRMEMMAAPMREKREREERQREQDLKRNAEKTRLYREAKEAFTAVKREMDSLHASFDLTTEEGRKAAVDQELRRTALKEILAAADRRLIDAERSVGRHRNGAF